jgi:cytochrome c-type biogenesis protein CcmE
MQRTIQFVVGGAIVLAILGTILYKSMETTVFFYTPGEILASPADFRERTIRIGALVVPQSTEWDPERVLLRFRVTEDNQSFLPVVYAGVKPDMYREGQGVVVEGRMDQGGVFRADNLLVKHSEEYSVEEDGKSPASHKEAAYRTLIK